MTSSSGDPWADRNAYVRAILEATRMLRDDGHVHDPDQCLSCAALKVLTDVIGR